MPLVDLRTNRLRLLGATLVLATLAIAIVIGYRAVDAAADHRRAAEASLRQHASIAAWRFAREARSWVGFVMAQAGDQLRADVAQRRVMPGPEVLQRLLAEKECDCVSAAFARTFFRITPADTALGTLIGDSLSASTRRSLVEIAHRILTDSVRRQEQEMWRLLPPGAPGLARRDDFVMLWHVPAASPGGPRAVYGMIVEVAQIVQQLKGAHEGAQLFPPTLVPPNRTDSLVRIEAHGPDGAPVFGAGLTRDTSYVGRDTVGVLYGEMVVSAALGPEAAEILLDEALPASSTSTTLALLALAAVVGVGAVVVLRREHRLAQLREDFVSGVSHELRTPLTQIRLLSELLDSGGLSAEDERARALRIINRESTRLTGLVENVLAFSRQRRTTSLQSTARTRLAEVVLEGQEAIVHLLADRGATMQVDLRARPVVPVDREAMMRVFRNLVENAIKYGPTGQTIRVTVDQTTPAAARMVIEDQGPGIPAAERERVFEAYYRLERDRNAPAGGTGIGLAVVAEIVRSAGGRVTVGDAPGGGARFTVELPGSAETEAR